MEFRKYYDVNKNCSIHYSRFEVVNELLAPKKGFASLLLPVYKSGLDRTELPNNSLKDTNNAVDYNIVYLFYLFLNYNGRSRLKRCPSHLTHRAPQRKLWADLQQNESK